MFSAVRRREVTGQPIKPSTALARMYLLNGNAELGLNTLERIMRHKGFVDDRGYPTAKMPHQVDNAFGFIVYRASWDILDARSLDPALATFDANY